MNSCYVVLKHVPNREAILVADDTTLHGLAENLFLAEKMIQNYYHEEFGADGSVLVCEVYPGWSDRRTYRCKKHYGAKDATYFTVFEEAIQNDMALL